MILLCAIVQSEDIDALTDRLVAQGIRLTRINTAGGFLTAGNVTILLGVEPGQVEDVMQTIGATCRTRRRMINAMPFAAEAAMMPFAGIAPMEVQIGGAVVFSVPVKRFLRLQGGAAPPAADEHEPRVRQAPDPTGGKPSMNLLLAIVHADHVEAVVAALLAAGHRLTRINSAGGFLRRGNATLLIGAEESQVEEILHLIQANCSLRHEPNPVGEGIPMYGATVFVLEAAEFARV